MTETSPCVLSSHKDRYHKYASTGVPVPSTMVKIVDVDTGNSQPAGKIGELRIKGPQVMKGYFKQPEANKDIFDQHGWLRTGDLGYYDEDGDFYVVDRLKELIKVKGFQVCSFQNKKKSSIKLRMVHDSKMFLTNNRSLLPN